MIDFSKQQKEIAWNKNICEHLDRWIVGFILNKSQRKTTDTRVIARHGKKNSTENERETQIESKDKNDSIAKKVSR